MPAAGRATSFTTTPHEAALDTDIVAYAEGTNGAVMRDKALELIQRLDARGKRC